MDDLKKHKHGDEGRGSTHSVCNKHNIGGKSLCCECSGKTDCEDMTQQEYKEKLWDKYCMQGDAENPDRMFYEQFCLAVEEIIQKAKEEERKRASEIIRNMPLLHNFVTIENGQTFSFNIKKFEKWFLQALTDLTNNLTEK